MYSVRNFKDSKSNDGIGIYRTFSTYQMHVRSIVLYIVSSLILTCLNAVFLHIIVVNSVVFILFCRSLMTMIFLAPMRHQIILPSFNIILMSFLNMSILMFTLLTNQTLSMTLANALRRLSIVSTLYIDCQYTTVQIKVIYAVITMVTGIFIMCIEDFQYNPLGYIFVTISNVLTTAYHFQTKKTLNENMTKISILFWSSLCSTVLYGGVLLLFNPFSFQVMTMESFNVIFIISIILGSFMKYSTVWVLEQNGPLTLSVSTIIQHLIFDTVLIVSTIMTSNGSLLYFIGSILSSTGAIVYIFVKKTPRRIDSVLSKPLGNTVGVH